MDSGPEPGVGGGEVDKALSRRPEKSLALWVPGSQMARGWVVACLALMRMTVYFLISASPSPNSTA